MGGLGSPYGQPGHHSPNGGGSMSSKRTTNRSEWESRCLWLSVLPFRSANYLGCVVILNVDSNGVFDIPNPPDVSSRRETVQDLDVTYRRFGVVALRTGIAERRWGLAGYLHA